MLVEQKKRADARGGRLTKFKGKVASIAPSLFLSTASIVALSVGIGSAEVVSTARTTPLVSASDEDHTITSSGSITVDPLSGSGLVVVNVPDFSSVLTNAGLLSSPEGLNTTHAGIVVSGDLSGSLLNSGTITMGAATGAAAVLTGIEIQGDVSGSLQSTGTIRIANSASNFGAAVGILTGDVVGTLSNTGTVSIIAGNADQAVGEAIGVGDISDRLQNSGNLTVSVSAASSATAAGINGRNLAGVFVNSGTITATADGTSAFAEGINLRDVSGTFENSGSIQVRAVAGSSAHANGIDMGDITGQVTNSGSIEVETEGSFAFADGIEMDDVSGQFRNSASITVAAVGTSSANAAGLEIDDISGNVTNSGTIQVSARNNGSSSAYAAGVEMGTLEDSGSFANSGTVSVEIKSDGSFLTRAFGLIGDDIDGVFSNTGDVEVTLQTQNGFIAEAFGLDLGDISSDGSFSNSGAIQIDATAQSVVSANATGIDISDIEGSFINSGNIAVSLDVDGASRAEALGIEPNDIAAGGSFSNSGSVTVNATAKSVTEIVALGIAASDVGGSLQNSGDIDVSASGDGDAIAYGLGAGNLSQDGVITHSGTIQVSADGTLAEAYGLYVDEAEGTVNITGDISATSSGESYAVFLGDGGGTLNIETTADIDGTIRVSDHNVNLTNVGGRAVYRFQDDDTTQGDFATKVSAPSQGWFVDGEGGSAPVYASFDAEEIQPNLNQSFEIAGLSYDLARQVQGSPDLGNSGERTVLSTSGSGPIEGFRPYFLISGSQSDADAGSDTLALSSNMWSVSAGTTRDLGTGLRYGIGASYLENDGSFGAASFDTTGVYLSGLVAQNFGFADLSFGLGYGHLDHNETRDVSGSDADADYSSDMFTAMVAAQRDYTLQSGAVLTPRASFLYGRQDLDGYTETGSSANATVGDRDVTFNETRLGGSYSTSLASGTLSASLAAVCRDSDAPSAVDVTIFGNTLQLASGGSGTETFGEIGLSYQKAFDHGGRLNLEARSTVGADVSTQAVWASYEWRF